MIATEIFNPYPFIAIASLIIAVLTYISQQRGFRHTVKEDYVTGLERRVKALEDKLIEANTKIKALEDQNGVLLKENIELLRKLAHMDNHIS
jgi:uncharacterized membrane protein